MTNQGQKGFLLDENKIGINMTGFLYVASGAIMVYPKNVWTYLVMSVPGIKQSLPWMVRKY